MSSETYYEILGINENADDDVVKQAFRDLAKHYHPDRNPDDAEAERQFKRINTAYEGLKDASRRQAYNEWLEFAQKRTKVKRTQWGRLAALVFLLLLGPSAVLYWAVVIADIPLFAENAIRCRLGAAERKTACCRPAPKSASRRAFRTGVRGAANRRATQTAAAQQPDNPAPAASPLAAVQPREFRPGWRASGERPTAPMPSSPTGPNRNDREFQQAVRAPLYGRVARNERSRRH